MEQYQWVSVREAARRLGISPETVRRRIEAGELVGEREAIGGSRERFRVRMETPQEAPQEAQELAMAPSSHDASPALTEASAGTTAALEILGGALAEERIERQRMATENAALHERVGRAEARAETLQSQMEQYILDQLEQTERAHRAEAALEASNAELERLKGRPWWRKIWG